MLLIRPVRLEDLDMLLSLAKEAGHGMTNMPADRGILESRVNLSLQSFAQSVEVPGDESYLFLMEDLATRRVVGTCGVIATVGLSRPFYSFRVIKLTHTSQELQIGRAHV